MLVHFGLKRSILVHLGPPTALWPFLIIGGAKTNGYQNAKFSKLKKLAILIPIRFDALLAAATETPKRVPKQTGTKIPCFSQRESNMHRIEVYHFASHFAPNF